MGSPLVNPGSAIISAYLEGRAQRAQREQAAAQQEFQQQQLLQREKEAQDEAKYRQDTLKQRADEAALEHEARQQQLANMKAQIDQAAQAQKLKHKVDVARLRSEDLEKYNRGTAKFPTQMQWGGLEGAMPVPTEQRVSEYNPHPDIEGYNPIQSSEVFAKPLNIVEQEEARKSREALAREGMASREWQTQQTNETRKQIADAMNQMRLLAIMTRGGSGTTRQQLNAINGIIKGHDTSKLNKDYNRFKEAIDYLDTRTGNPDAPDVNDMTLVYQWIRSQDDSAVKEGEYAMASKIGISTAEWLAMKARRLVDSTQFLTDAARTAIEKDMRTRFDVKSKAYSKAVESLYKRAQDYDKDMTFDEFNGRLQSGALIPPSFASDAQGGANSRPSVGTAQPQMTIPGLGGLEDSGRRRK